MNSVFLRTGWLFWPVPRQNLAMRWFLLCAAAAVACAQSFEVTPNPVPQGGTLHVRGGENAAQARLDGRTIRLFPQKDGGSLGLMPIPALEKPGDYQLELLGKDGAIVQTIDVVVKDAHFPKQNVALT